MDLLLIEQEKLDDLNLDFLRCKAERQSQESIMSEDENDTSTLDKSSEH